MMRATRILALVSMSALTVGVTALPSEARVTKCFGERATIVGTDGHDVLEGTAGRDVIVGLGGRDDIRGGAGRDLICGGPNPRESDSDNQPLSEHLSGGAGADRLSGGRGRDDLRGDAGDDRIFGGPGRDFTLEAGSPSPKERGDDIIKGGRGNDHLVENLGTNIVLGGRGDDFMIGGERDDSLRGGKGNDVLAGNDGDDTLRGGKGRDVAEYLWDYEAFGAASHSKDITVNLQKGTGRGMGRDSLARIEIVWTGGGKDTLIGNSLNNAFYIGTRGEGAAHDYVNGKGGSDTLTFDSSSIEGFCCSRLFADLAAGTGKWGGVGFSLRSIENILGSGSTFRSGDKLLGNSARNVLKSGGGRFSANDTIRGRGGADRLVGLGGDDQLAGGLGPDKLFGGKGSDLLDGNGGKNRNDGGRGADRCVNPTSAEGAVNCES